MMGPLRIQEHGHIGLPRVSGEVAELAAIGRKGGLPQRLCVSLLASRFGHIEHATEESVKVYGPVRECICGAAVPAICERDLAS